ncbi:unnamed protein product [Adineta steineri]|uniref:Uncharacterized protein n=2 Tax=Adineta steineri TaxID=433720 RepID=A0A819NV27_9BILA|nr:unnamed protein product [Adineta steineri]
MAEPQLDAVAPVQLSDEEPRILFLHLNVAIDLYRYLRFYKNIATIFDSKVALHNQLAIHDRLFTVVALLPDQVSNANLNFNPINVEPDTTFDYIYLLYKTDRIYVTLTIDRSRYQEPAPSHSPSNNTLKKIIWIISKSLDRNVKYYEERARRSDENGNYALAALYKQLQLERNQLRIAAMQQLSDLI